MRPASMLLCPDPGGPGRGQRPVQNIHPCRPWLISLRECGRRDSQHRAAGVGQAAAAYPAVDHLGQRVAVARPEGLTT